MESDLNCQNQAGMLTVFLLNQTHRQKLDILSIQARFEARVLSSVLYIRYTSIPLVQKNIGDLVPRSRFGGSRTKNGGGEGKGEEETRSGKIRLRGPELAHKSTVHGPSLTCFSCVQYSHRVGQRVAFCF